MNKSTIIQSIVGSTLGIFTDDIQIQKGEYPIAFIEPFTYIVFFMGALITKLNPKVLQNIRTEIKENTTLDISEAKDWVEKMEYTREQSDLKTSNVYFVWVNGEVADLMKQGKNVVGIDYIFKLGILSFLYGCILGMKNPDCIEPMFEADRNQDREKSLKSSADLSFEYLEEYVTEALKQVQIIDDKQDEFEYYCDECGAIINKDDKFCSKCGVEFDDEEN